MDKDRVKGTANDAAGRAKRQVGEWTGDPKTQVEGAAQQLKGKAQKAMGNVKDAVRGANGNASRESGNAQDRDHPADPQHAHADHNR
jgi:uncharacterized protein YjbJ (UPF0337 family)